MKTVNKIVASLLAAVSFPLLITQLFINIVLSVDKDSTAYTLINSLFGSDNKLTNNSLGIQYSLVDLFNMLTGRKQSDLGIDINEFLSKLPSEFESIKKYVIASFVFVAVGAFIAIVVIGCVLFTKAHKTVIVMSLGSSVSYLIAIILFGRAGRPLYDGTIDVVSVIANMLSGEDSSIVGALASSMLSGAVKVDTFALGGAVFGAMIMMFAAAIWEIAYLITLPPEEKLKKNAKKIKKA
ncbi:MAG: hypothetical protein ACI4XH_01475 [Acutalibacteraceae bacterium]